MSKRYEPTLIGALIRAYREAKGLTQTELSEKVGMSQEWASQLERGKIRRPRVEVLHPLAQVLDAPFEQLVTAARYPSTVNVMTKIMPQEIEDPDIAQAFLGLKKLSERSPERLRTVQAVIDGLAALDEHKAT